LKVIKERYVNFQSLQDITYELIPGINNFVGRNNAGKSVRVKALRAMCTPNFYTSDERKELIRTDCEFAAVIKTLEDGRDVVFVLYPTYQMYVFDGITYRQNTCPEPIKEAMGLIVDEESKTILNLLDLEQETIFSGGPNYEDAKWLKFIIGNNKMEEVLANLDGYQERLDTLAQISLNNTIRLNNRIGSMARVNTAVLEDSIERRKVIIAKAERLDIADTALSVNIPPVPVMPEVVDFSGTQRLSKAYFALRTWPSELIPVEEVKYDKDGYNRLAKAWAALRTNVPEVKEPEAVCTSEYYDMLWKLLEIIKLYDEIDALHKSVEDIAMSEYCPLCSSYLGGRNEGSCCNT
jgi:hypothetical protein